MIPDAIAIALLVTLCAAGPIGLVVAGRWIVRRADRHEYSDAFIPDRRDVAAGEAEIDALIGLSEVNDILDALNREFDRLLERGA